MKKKFLIVIALLAIGMFGCQKEGVMNNPDQNSASFSFDVKPGPLTQLWTIGSFIINKDDVTRAFDSFVFEFYPDNTARATDGYIEIPGKWDVVNDQYFFYFEISKVNVTISPVDYQLGLFTELNGYWNIIKKYPTGVLLRMSSISSFKELRFDF